MIVSIWSMDGNEKSTIMETQLAVEHIYLVLNIITDKVRPVWHKCVSLLMSTSCEEIDEDLNATAGPQHRLYDCHVDLWQVYPLTLIDYVETTA